MIKTLAKSIREYKKETILTPLTMVGEVVMEVLITDLLADLIDLGINAGAESHLLFLLVFIG